MSQKNNKKTAVVLMNLGGPSSLRGVKPFLFKLFFDRSIINLPLFFRWPLAKYIAFRRDKYAQNIYKQIGGASPILKETEAQAKALQNSLEEHGNYKTFIAMRYSIPDSNEAIDNIKKYEPDEIILLPLYPQFSTTTTKSSSLEFEKELIKANFKVPVKKICCYPENKKFISAHVDLLLKEINKIKNHKIPFRVLFSAHGLPQNIIDAGDPYEKQVEKTVHCVLRSLEAESGIEFDYKICYQSRVGPLKWLGPSTADEVIRAGVEERAVIISPIAFVSEHSETLVELDIDFKKLALENGVPKFIRTPTLSTNRLFIDALKDLCLNSSSSKKCPLGFLN